MYMYNSGKAGQCRLAATYYSNGARLPNNDFQYHNSQSAASQKLSCPLLLTL
jgi:hypothetical protein